MQRVLVGTDGSSNGQAAVRWAVDLAGAAHCELVVATAWRPASTQVAPHTYDEYEERRDQARRVVDEQWCVPARDAGVAFRPLLLEGDPRDLLLRAAAEADADLVVVGARGAGGHRHALHLGSVTHHLVHHTTVPLVAVPASARSSWPARVVVGVDGSAGSGEAVAWCRDLAPQLRTEVIAVYAERPLAQWVPRTDPHSWYQSAVRHCEVWAGPLREAGITTRALVIEDEPVGGLTDTAIGERADIIVVGTRGAGGIRGLRLGSTALGILHCSGLPVVLVPPSVEHHAAA
jgi:nucleotide-binding universal stress UspA family protein